MRGVDSGAASASTAGGSCTVGFMTAVDIVVVGAGVVGLTTAISLAEAGLSTRVVAAEPPSAVTSVAAGAIWGPVRCGPDDRCHAWARTGLEVLSALTDEASAGVHQLHGRAVGRTAQTPPTWADLLSDARLLTAAERPAGFGFGWSYTAPAVNMPVYLEYLLGRYARGGGTVSYATVASLASVDAPVVVNCTGIGARSLVPDESLVPVRGQVVVAENPGISEFYIEPRGARQHATTSTRSRTATWSSWAARPRRGRPTGRRGRRSRRGSCATARRCSRPCAGRGW